MRLPTVALGALALAGCAAIEPRCPESSTVCVAGYDCALDARRDCMVCLCRATSSTEPPRDGKAATAYPESVPVPTGPPPPRDP